MNQYTIELTLTKKTKIGIQFKDPIENIGWDYAQPITFFHDNNTILIAKGPTYFNIKDMHDFLTKAINHQLILDPSINNDIGYLCNQYHKNETGFKIKNVNGTDDLWVGYEYHVWEARNNNTRYMTWLYNDSFNNIIFKITPLYPYFYYTKKKDIHYIAYKKWILNYKPYFTATISRDTAHEWIEKTEYIIHTIDDNIRRWRGNKKGYR